MPDETFVIYGGEVKALGEGKVGGYLVRYGNPKDTDITGDFFSAETDLGVDEGSRLPVYYHHGMDGQVKTKRIGRAVVKYDDLGAWVEAQLEMRDEYEKMIYELAEAGKLGWSSGAAGHLVEREPVGKAYHIKSWPIAEASLTPTPAEPRNSAVPLKSLLSTDEQAEAEPEAGSGPAAEDEPVKSDDMPQVQVIEPQKEGTKMEPEEIKTMIADAAKAAAEEAIKALPAVKPAEYATPKDKEDPRFFSNAGQFLKSVKSAFEGRGLTPELERHVNWVKATGLNEGTPADGGYLVPPQYAAGIGEKMWNTGQLLSFFSPITVAGNSMSFNVVDETSRVDGSRGGGVLGYWLAESATKTATKPQFAQNDLKLKKVAALCYATDELLEDASALESWINRYVPQELRFKVEDAIINGTGVGMPQGVLNATALVSATRTDASEIDSYDIARMWQRRYIGANDYIWLYNASAFVQLVNMTLGNYPVYMPPGGISAAPYGSIFGRPAFETEYNPALGTLGDILLVSPSHYQMIVKGGIQAATSIHVQFVTDETAFRFVYRVDGMSEWRSAVTPFKGSDTISPFVALAATT